MDTISIMLAILGIFIALVSLFLIVYPDPFRHLLQSITVSTPIRLFGAMTRIGIGLILISMAKHTQYEVAVYVIGGLILLAGLVILFTRNEKIQSMLDYFSALGDMPFRVGGIVGMLMGGSLVYFVI